MVFCKTPTKLTHELNFYFCQIYHNIQHTYIKDMGGKSKNENIDSNPFKLSLYEMIVLVKITT